jgi:hypothetical protein
LTPYDPRIHQEIFFHLMDCRVKPGNDGSLFAHSPDLELM